MIEIIVLVVVGVVVALQHAQYKDRVARHEETLFRYGALIISHQERQEKERSALLALGVTYDADQDVFVLNTPEGRFTRGV